MVPFQTLWPRFYTLYVEIISANNNKSVWSKSSKTNQKEETTNNLNTRQSFIQWNIVILHFLLVRCFLIGREGKPNIKKVLYISSQGDIVAWKGETCCPIPCAFSQNEQRSCSNNGKGLLCTIITRRQSGMREQVSSPSQSAIFTRQCLVLRTSPQTTCNNIHIAWTEFPCLKLLCGMIVALTSHGRQGEGLSGPLLQLLIMHNLRLNPAFQHWCSHKNKYPLLWLLLNHRMEKIPSWHGFNSAGKLDRINLHYANIYIAFTAQSWPALAQPGCMACTVSSPGYEVTGGLLGIREYVSA